jgi:sec-independent protein translocase protein TatC
VFGLLFLSLIYFANNLYTLLANPLLKFLPHDRGLIATNIIAPFFVPFELTCFVALFLSIPFFLHQLWGFVAPALYKKEKKFIVPLILISATLFYLGMSFAYWVILPIFFNFIVHTTPQGVMLAPDISQYLEFTLKLFFLFGTLFEVPVAIIVLVWSGVTTREKLIAFRPYAIVGSFVIGMLCAPPDVVSQTLLAVPLWLLYELGIILAKLFLGAAVKQGMRNT